MKLSDYNNEFGDIDLFLLDLLLKGYINEDAKILDAGCGSGRNTFFFLKHGYSVNAIDMLKAEVNATNFMSRALGRGDVAVVGSILELPYSDKEFGLIVCSRVLHFANGSNDFEQMISELSRVLKDDGILYLSMNSAIGKIHEGSKEVSYGLLFTTDLIKNLQKNWLSIYHTRTIVFDESHEETTLVLKKK